MQGASSSYQFKDSHFLLLLPSGTAATIFPFPISRLLRLCNICQGSGNAVKSKLLEFFCSCLALRAPHTHPCFHTGSSKLFGFGTAALKHTLLVNNSIYFYAASTSASVWCAICNWEKVCTHVMKLHAHRSFKERNTSQHFNRFLFQFCGISFNYPWDMK